MLYVGAVALMSRPTRRQPEAPGAVASAGALFGVSSLGICAASAALTRVPSGGSWPAVRTTIQLPAVLPALGRRTKLPTNVAPAGRTTTSPGTAASSAACRLPPTGTVIVRPVCTGIAVTTDASGSSAPDSDVGAGS